MAQYIDLSARPAAAFSVIGLLSLFREEGIAQCLERPSLSAFEGHGIAQCLYGSNPVSVGLAIKTYTHRVASCLHAFTYIMYNVQSNVYLYT